MCRVAPCWNSLSLTARLRDGGKACVPAASAHSVARMVSLSSVFEVSGLCTVILLVGWLCTIIELGDHTERLPWRGFKGIDNQMSSAGPTLMTGEALTVVATLVSAAHAVKHGRKHVLVWISALVSGTTNDLIFMLALPFVDNFFHAQCTLMWTPRLPFYIPCVYIVFQYACTVGTWRLGLGATEVAAAAGGKDGGGGGGGSLAGDLAQPAAAALSGAVYYAIYDITGAKFLWWTWHDTDSATFDRWFGVPVGSSMWTLIHLACFNVLLNWLAVGRTREPLTAMRFVTTTAIVSVLTTPMMMVVMGMSQMHQLRLDVASFPWLVFPLDWSSYPPFLASPATLPGKPDAASIAIVIAVFVALVLKAAMAQSSSARRRKQVEPIHWWLAPDKASDRMLFVSVVLWFVCFVCIMLTGDPATITATGCHQPVGPCGIEEVDLSNYTRHRYLCKDNYDEDFHFGCPAAKSQEWPPQLSPSWFTLCGRQFPAAAQGEGNLRWQYVGVTILLAGSGIAMFGRMLLHSSGEEDGEDKKGK